MIYYNFIIATNQYAGNFEREMCAYMTGVIGECEVGKKMAELFDKEVLLLDKYTYYEDPDEPFVDNLQDIVEQRSDGTCYRPVKIYYVPEQKAYNAVAIHLNKIPTAKQLGFLKQRANQFATSYLENLPEYAKGLDVSKNIDELKILSFKLESITTTYDVQDI